MNHPIRIALLIAALVLGSLGFARTSSAEEITTIDMAQLRTQLAAAKGKVVFLNFFATWCPPCREEIPALVRLRDKFPADKVVFLGIGVDDSPAILADFIAEYKIQYPVMVDSGDIARNYRISSIPHNIIYDKNGKLAVSQVGIINEGELDRFLTRLMAE